MTDPSAGPCPCRSGKPYPECCGHYHGGQLAPDPEALMRSRYTAFVLGNADYLQLTWHTSTRPAQLPLNDDVSWKGLEVLSSEAGQTDGNVSFTAVFTEHGRWMKLTESSRFVLEAGAWFYVDGDTQWIPLQPGRNDSCPCGSGKKFKKCCG